MWIATKWIFVNKFIAMEKDLYFVAVKVFLLDSHGRLLIIKDIYDDGWDLPGGRLRPVDFDAPLEEVVQRKMNEEVGDKVKYKLGKPVVFFRHERDEVLASGNKEKRRIFAVGYEAEYLGGEIQLGDCLKDYKWVVIKDFKPEDYFIGGWLKGVQEYLKFRHNI